MKHRWIGASVLLVGLVLVVTLTATATTYSNWSGNYKLGETVLFKVNSQQLWWWGCCCCNQQPTCPTVQISGWHVADSTGKTVYKVVFDQPVAATSWQGSWGQVDSSNKAVPAGYYMLYVDTSVGTLSHYIRIYDPCSCCWSWYWSCNACGEVPSITNCGCRTSLVLLKNVEKTSCRPLFWWPCGNPCCNH